LGEVRWGQENWNGEVRWGQENYYWKFEVYNLWVGKWVSVLEMIKESEKVTWKKINYKIVDRRSWDVAEMFCNPQKAFDELWWKSNTSLEDSLRNSWKYYRI
jgi:UDP-glucose 4-epimerase